MKYLLIALKWFVGFILTTFLFILAFVVALSTPVGV